MRVEIIFKLVFYVSLNAVQCSTAIDSYELNSVEFTPLHDAIIFNDIADVLNEFENNMNPQLNIHNTFSDSESEEDIENLLSKYQHYLDKAHKQKLVYIEKNKRKNKVPNLRRDRFTKLKPAQNNDKSNSYFDNVKNQASFLHPLDLFMPHHSNMMAQKIQLLNNNNPKTLLSLPPVLPKLTTDSYRLEPSCYCKYDEIPCKCACKECLVPSSPYSTSFKKIVNSKYTTDYNKSHNALDNFLNLKIKIEVQVPNISGISDLYKHPSQDKAEVQDEAVTKEIFSTINVPFPYLNFPIPMELFGYKNLFNYESTPLHKITIQKKKKSRFNNNNKRHKSKKVITFHTFKVDSQQNQEHLNNTEKFYENTEATKNHSLNYNITESIIDKKYDAYNVVTNNTNDTTTDTPNKNATLPIELIASILNLSNIDNRTNEIPKIDNSIEIDLEKNSNNTDLMPLRLRREIPTTKVTTMKIIKKNETAGELINATDFNYTRDVKRLDKMALIDMELLHWPVEYSNHSLDGSNNITALILSTETKKAKLNLTHDTIRNNRTVALEHAIFGDVDWNDVDSVVPVFISFVGKYIRGILTFCSEKTCHSMKCADKVCVHRICTPEHRYNNIGHCMGNNFTESVAILESIMDLPSNMTFEVVNILQDKMLGNMYGKVTLCINSKCCTFAVSKKKYHKSKCTRKELNSAGHCVNTKNMKLL